MPHLPVVLVTGAAGFAGSHLLEHLAGSADLVAWSRKAPPPALSALARWESVDLLDRDAVTKALGVLRPDRVFHCAGLPYVAESWSDTAAPLAVNVMGTHFLLDVLATLKSRCRVVVTGSAHVYAPSDDPIDENGTLAPSSPYALSKLAQEQLALRAGTGTLDVIVARSFNHTGPRQKPNFVAPSVARQIALIELGQMEPVIKVGNREPRRDLMDVRDVVRAYARLMDAGEPAGVYNVASGVGRPVRDLVDALVTRARVPIRVEQDPSRFRANDMPVLVGNPRRLQDATGWRTEFSFDQMVGDLLGYWRTTGG